MIVSLNVPVPEELHYQVKQKCRMNNLTIQEVVAALLDKFCTDEFDNFFEVKVKNK